LEPRIILRSIAGRTYARDRQDGRVIDLGPSARHSTFVAAGDFEAFYEAQASRSSEADQEALRNLWDTSERSSDAKHTAAPLSKETLEALVNLSNRQQLVFGGQLKGKIDGRDVPPPPTPSGPPTLLEMIGREDAPFPGPLGSEPLGTMGTFNSGALNTQALDQGPVIEPKHAPEPVREIPADLRVDLQVVVKKSSTVAANNETTGERTFRADPSLRPGVAGFVERPASAGDKSIALFQLRNLIEAFEEAAGFDRARNVRPPVLWIENDQYLAELKDILIELRELKQVLEAAQIARAVSSDAEKTASKLDKFIDSYMSEMGKGAAQLTKAGIVLALVWAGLGEATLAKFMSQK